MSLVNQQGDIAPVLARILMKNSFMDANSSRLDRQKVTGTPSSNSSNTSKEFNLKS